MPLRLLKSLKSVLRSRLSSRTTRVASAEDPNLVHTRYFNDIIYDEELSSIYGFQVSLDAYLLSPSICNGSVIYLHGGGLSTGSKKAIHGMNKFFNSLGYNFLSCNYPLASIGNDTSINIQMSCLASIDHWAADTLPKLAEVSSDTPVIYLGHSAGSYLLSLGLSKDTYKSTGRSFILIDSAAYDLRRRHYAARPSVKSEIERLIGYTSNSSDTSLEQLLLQYSPLDSLFSASFPLNLDSNSWLYFASTSKRLSREGSIAIASILRNKFHVNAKAKAYASSHSQILKDIGLPGTQIADDITRLLIEHRNC